MKSGLMFSCCNVSLWPYIKKLKGSQSRTLRPNSPTLKIHTRNLYGSQPENQTQILPRCTLHFHWLLLPAFGGKASQRYLQQVGLWYITGTESSSPGTHWNKGLHKRHRRVKFQYPQAFTGLHFSVFIILSQTFG